MAYTSPFADGHRWRPFVDGSHLRGAPRAGCASRSVVSIAWPGSGRGQLRGTRSGRASLGALMAARERWRGSGARSTRSVVAVSTVAVASSSEQACRLAGTALRAEPGLRAGAGTGFARAGGIGTLRLPAVPNGGALLNKAKASATLCPNWSFKGTCPGKPGPAP